MLSNGELCGKIFPVRTANLRFSGDRSDEFIELNIAIENFCEKSATKMISPFESHRFVFKQNNGHFLILNLRSH